MGRLAGVVVLAAVIAFCVAQDRGTSAGVGRYIAAQRAAPAEGRADRGTTVTIDEVMGPIGALVFRRVRLKADTTRSRLRADTMRSRRG